MRTDPLASPTGFPFKVADLPGTVADPHVYAQRRRVCEAGYLRVPYRKEDGDVGYRCPAEPASAYVRKGGKLEETAERRCVCNGLIAAIGLGQRHRDGAIEPPLATIGQDLSFLPALLGTGRDSYKAADAWPTSFRVSPTTSVVDRGASRPERPGAARVRANA